MKQTWVIPIIVVAAAGWALFHAYGAYTLNHNPWRAVMVAGCMAAFLGFWGAMLAARRSRLKRESDARSGRSDVRS